MTDKPLGWTISNYEGVADGPRRIPGYYQDRRRSVTGAEEVNRQRRDRHRSRQGGPVVAKEAGRRGLDVLLLEAGARHADPGASGRISRTTPTIPSQGTFASGRPGQARLAA